MRCRFGWRSAMNISWSMPGPTPTIRIPSGGNSFAAQRLTIRHPWTVRVSRNGGPLPLERESKCAPVTCSKRSRRTSQSRPNTTATRGCKILLPIGVTLVSTAPTGNISIVRTTSGYGPARGRVVLSHARRSRLFSGRRRRGSGELAGTTHRVFFERSQRCDWEIVRGSDDPKLGWRSHRFNQETVRRYSARHAKSKA